MRSFRTTYQKKFLHDFRNKDVIILYGNIRDKYVFNTGNTMLEVSFDEMMTRVLAEAGYSKVRTYDPYSKVQELSIEIGGGFKVEEVPNFGTLGFGGDKDAVISRIAAGIEVSGNNKQVWLLKYMHNVLPYRNNYPGEDSMRLIAFQRMIENIAPGNKLILCYLSDTMTPIEFSENSHRIALVKIPIPDFDERKQFWLYRIRLSVGVELSSELSLKMEALASELSKQTDGLALSALIHLGDSANSRLQQRKNGKTLLDISSRDWEVTINSLKFAEATDRFRQISIDQLKEAKDFFIEKEGVRGQDHAVKCAVEMLYKARTNLGSLLQGTSNAPRGVLFFCGPSGVGKTFLSKKIAKFVFGSEDAFHRFDMSEYQQDYTISKLIGSPPGYVGFEMGGLLTNAVLEKPFSVVLFDEIEKAHPRILDIFLQILSDGRLTDARGQVVFFSQSIIIFTSNIGARSSVNTVTGVREHVLLQQAQESQNPSEAVRDHFIESVRNFFKYEISRPELLNRIGNNIIPFNYLEQKEVLYVTVQHYLKLLARNFEHEYKQKGLELQIEEDKVAHFIVRKHGDAIREFGGRAVLNILDNYLLPQLAKCMLGFELREERTGGSLGTHTIRVDVLPNQLDLSASLI